MAKTRIQELFQAGQSIWLDNINRKMIEGGMLKQMIAQGLLGMTSNPTIFDKAVSSSSDYDLSIKQLTKINKANFDVYDELTVKDVQDAADLFFPVYEKTQGLDGYVSLEVNPQLADQAKDTIKEALRLADKVNRLNVMFKVPATTQGFKAVEELISRGININVTLIFSLSQYLAAANAYLKGIKRFLENGGNVSRVRSVASVFVSRIDSVVDKKLDELLAQAGAAEAVKLNSLKGKAAIANCRLIYNSYLAIIASDEFAGLSVEGVNIQRVLWASTSTKNPAYSDIKYVTELIAQATVNTLPEATFEAFLDHGQIEETLNNDVFTAEKIIAELKSLGIDLNEVCQELLKQGVVAFEDSFASLLKAIEAKKEKLRQRVF